MIISICFLKRENAFTTFAKISYLDDQVVTYQSVEDCERILVTLTSHCDFHYKHLNISFSENKLIVDLNSNCQDCSIPKNRNKKLHGFWQTDMVEFLINERNLSMI